MANKSRAEYFRKRRETNRQFTIWLRKDYLDKIDQMMKEKGISRTEWVKQKLADDFGLLY